ncbi:MAG: sensor histidine kinase [Acidimicrobiales bacterium]
MVSLAALRETWLPDSLLARAVSYDRGRPQVGDALGVLVLAVAATAWTVLHTQGGPAVWLCDAGLLLPLVWRRRRPVAVFVLLAAVALAQWLWAAPLLADVALLGAIFTLALERPFGQALGAGMVVEIGAAMASARWSLAGSWTRSLVALSGLVAAALLLGAVLRSRRARMAELTDRADRLEVERDQQAQISAAAERTRIAREMHDIIAHSLAVIVTMADGAAAKLARDPERAAAAISAISGVGRQALGDTRRLLGVLRDGRGGADLAPQPGLDQLHPLIGQLGATGLDATCNTEGTPFPLPPGAELTVYRLVQEAGTNTLKHAVGATSFRARLVYEYPRLTVEVADDGAGSLPRAAGAGHGLAGMGERVALYGGTVTSGPSPEGGWVLRADLTAPPYQYDG